ncbi:YicC/YloC family endoribonuclease [Phenylobacterium soli]|uniref:YicC family protein n=1 Tax=Phenylobacterium soli TaxID=2170551 RepID=A0A328AKS2_9CAUL|nr:YicC/YloC family endoribonuclease [Phenylobacterium soli]RAK55199.1 YicC family protein [Phenylobacterium soli]
MTISGMTGFGRAEGAANGWSWAVEARSVNGRNLEVRFRGPPGFDALERAAREQAQQRFSRGQVSVGVQAKRLEGGAAVRLNLEQLERYLAAGEPYLTAGKAGPPSFDGLLALKGVIETEDAVEDPDARAELEVAMAASIGQAMDGLLQARREEGVALEGLLTGFLVRIADLVERAEAIAGEQPAAIKERFAKRMVDLIGEGADEARITQEAAVMAVKADVREELDRLAGHVTAARQLLASDGGVGRRLDFLTQEFMREANTLCSKSASRDLTATGLDLKAVIDQFREQVQNLE